MTISEEDKAFLTQYRVVPSTGRSREVPGGSRIVNTNESQKNDYQELGEQFLDKALSGYTRVKLSDIPNKQRR